MDLAGDNSLEVYRASTFLQSPIQCCVTRVNLAKSGFYYTGYADRIKCYGCGITIEKWGTAHDPSSARWHRADCRINQGENATAGPQSPHFAAHHGFTTAMNAVITNSIALANAGVALSNAAFPDAAIDRRPRGRWRMANVVSDDHKKFLRNLYLNREIDRLASFSRWPISRPNISPASLAKNGFFYLGDHDRTQCFSCGGVLRNWSIDDDAEEEHRTHFPTCIMAQGRENRNVAVPAQPESTVERMARYPCPYAASLHMSNRENRFGTFDQRWPGNCTRATPAQIADAGFFFLGERDRVKCWYCNGGLQNWEYDDDPWEEHAKWFPNCQFLLREKGQAFVHQHLSTHPHLARPIIAKQEGSTLPSVNGDGTEDSSPGGASEQPNTRPPVIIIDPQEELRKKKEKISKTLENSEICKNVLAMGFSTELVKLVLEDRVNAGTEANVNDIYDSTSSLLDDVMKKEVEMQMEVDEDQSSIESDSPETSCTSIGKSAHLLRAEIEKIEEERTCKVCFSSEADMVFVPCGHMCCCIECTRSIRRCPFCRTRIEKAIRAYVE